MKMSKAFPIKLGIYTLVFSYISLDLFYFHGPVKSMVDNRSGKNKAQMVQVMEEQQIAAFVYMSPIYLSQVDYRVVENTNSAGISLQNLKPSALTHLRQKALNELIEDSIFRVKTEANEDELHVPKELVNHSLQRLTKRFPQKIEPSRVYSYTGIEGKKEMRLRIQAMYEQEQYLDSLLSPKITTEENSIRAFYDNNLSKFTIPYQVKARHIFLSKLDHPKDGETLAKQVLKNLQAGASFSSLAKKYSNDPRTNKIGGELGWISKKRTLPSLQKFLFESKSTAPTLLESKIGWHIIQKTETQASKTLPYNLVKSQLEKAMTNTAQQEVIQKMRSDMRIYAGTRYRHTDTTKDYTTIKGRTSTIQRFPEILTSPFSFQLE